jgi:hypothetical protein
VLAATISEEAPKSKRENAKACIDGYARIDAQLARQAA